MFGIEKIVTKADTRHPRDKFRTGIDDLIAAGLLEYLSKAVMADILQERAENLRRQEAIGYAPTKIHSGNAR
jgi:hypothetical protein